MPAPASAPVRRANRNISLREIKPNAEENRNDYNNPESISVAVAAESPIFPKKNSSYQSMMNVIPNDEADDVRVYERPASSVMTRKNHSRPESRQTVELSMRKKQSVKEDEFQAALLSKMKLSEDLDSSQKILDPHFHENPDQEQLDVSAYLIPCDICGRKFMEARLVLLID